MKKDGEKNLHGANMRNLNRKEILNFTCIFYLLLLLVYKIAMNTIDILASETQILLQHVASRIISVLPVECFVCELIWNRLFAQK